MTTTATHAPPADTVAVVGGRPLVAGDVEQRLELIRAEAGPENLPVDGSPEAERLRRWVVHTLIDEALVESAAVELGRPPRASAAQPLADGAVVAVFDAVTASVCVDDRDVQDHYERNLRRYERPEERQVAQVVAADPAVATQLCRLAADHGLEGAATSVGLSRADGVEVMRVRRGQTGAAFERAVFEAEVGEVVGPLRTTLGWHVLTVTAVMEERFEPLATVAADIRADLLAAARGRGFDTWLAEQHRRQVVVMRGYEHPGDPRVPNSIHRH